MGKKNVVQENYDENYLSMKLTRLKTINEVINAKLKHCTVFTVWPRYWLVYGVYGGHKAAAMVYSNRD